MPLSLHCREIPQTGPPVVGALFVEERRKIVGRRQKKKEKLVVGLFSQFLVMVSTSRRSTETMLEVSDLLIFMILCKINNSIENLMHAYGESSRNRGYNNSNAKEPNAPKKNSKIMKPSSLLHSSSMSRTPFA